MNYDVNMGIGAATGMFFHAPEGTALPEYPSAQLPAAWKEGGMVSEDGITFSPAREADTLKNWAKKIVRLLPSEDNPTVEAPLITSTVETLKTVFGAENVTVVEAAAGHGETTTIEINPNKLPGKEAFIFLMKDGDDLIMLGTDSGAIKSVADVAMEPSGAITWTVKIEADTWFYVKEATNA